MEPIGGITRGMFQVGEKKELINGLYAGTYWMSVRPCPTCEKKLFTNGKKFVCTACGFEEAFKTKNRK